MTTIQSKKKINIICTFVLLSFSLLFNVSYAGFGSTGRAIWKVQASSATTDVDHQITENYSMYDIYGIVSGYSRGEISEYIYKSMCSDLETNGFAFVYSHSGSYTPLMVYPYETVDIGYVESTNTICVYGSTSEIVNVYVRSGTGNPGYQGKWTTRNTSSHACYYEHAYSAVPTLYTHDIKALTISSSKLYWDGESYSYKAPTSLPSNAEITQAVQSFYNSDYYKNNKDFKDFLVMYNYKTQYFSFIGHNFGIDLGQVIVPPNYEYEGHSYNQDWWKFYLRNISSEIASNLWNRYYWLYSTNDFGETIQSDGKGSIKDLLDLCFSTSSTIVYSTTDYPVVKIELDEETGILEPIEGTIPGDQYTYDENLNPTTNEYNPLENFVPTNPTQSIIGNIDFSEINKVFEENKDILNTSGATWLFTANNQLVSYFLGFLLFVIILFIISRVLGG